MNFSVLEYLPITDFQIFVETVRISNILLRKKYKSERRFLLSLCQKQHKHEPQARDTETSLPKELLHFCQKWAQLN